ncbi:hypothetical protein [Staphylococcus sp. NAM3COL9]|uniref:hypothetical protein n=1 Tax=Staphylococcus sp. NAM3COL9 TaxID=1667172 RepID=UPI000B0DFB19|nr:hypothetical protein [Staphylococcus sp. NAM3COL9]
MIILLAYNKEIETKVEENNNSENPPSASCDTLSAAGASHTLATTGAMAALEVSGPVG